ncbi:MAG: carboxypeptidase regulatory-like domain-containing protein [Blastocatellales bacterium]
MLKLGYTVGLLAALLSFHLADSIQAQPTVAKPGTATVSGRVTLNGEPVANAVVALQNPPGPSRSPGIRVKTDGDGRFHFAGVAAGRYVLGALAPGFISPSDQSYGPQGNLITISEGEKMEGVSIELKRGGAIAGRVTDSRGRPVVEENIFLMRLDEQGRPRQFNNPMNMYFRGTDDRGFYRLYGLPAGRYLVSVGYKFQEGFYGTRQERIFYSQTFHQDATEESKAEVVELSEGGEVTGVDITVAETKRAYTVSGRMVDAETGQPVVVTDISYGRVMADGRSRGWTTTSPGTDANGGFQLTLPPGKYSLLGGRSNSDYFADPVMIEVNDKDVSGVEIKVRKGIAISGVAMVEGIYDRAVLAKLPSLSLTAHRQSNDSFSSISRYARINPDGGFRITGLPPGKITFSLSGQFGANKFSILRIERNGVSQGRQIELGAGEKAHYLRVVLGYGVAAIRGQVKVVGGALPPEIVIHARAKSIGGDQSVYFNAQADSSGQFVIEGLAAGEYELRLSYQRRANAAGAESQLLRKFLQQLWQVKQTVSVGATGETKVTLTFDLSQKEGQ